MPNNTWEAEESVVASVKVQPVAEVPVGMAPQDGSRKMCHGTMLPS